MLFSVEACQCASRDRNLARRRLQGIKLDTHCGAARLQRGQHRGTRLTRIQMCGYPGSFGCVQRAVEIGMEQTGVALHCFLQAASNAASARASKAPTDRGAIPSAAAISR